MIYGVGIDLVRIERIREAAERWGERFLERVYTPDEISYCYKNKNPYLSLAVRFAAKEALVKAANPGTPFSLREIEVFNYPTGKPSLRLSGSLQTLFEERKIRVAHLSLSHEKDYGIACVVLEGE
ncbi:MAG: holo-ACP synthase [Thermodesulfovibrionales bacterium]